MKKAITLFILAFSFLCLQAQSTFMGYQLGMDQSEVRENLLGEGFSIIEESPVHINAVPATEGPILDLEFDFSPETHALQWWQVYFLPTADLDATSLQESILDSLETLHGTGWFWNEERDCLQWDLEGGQRVRAAWCGFDPQTFVVDYKYQELYEIW